MLIHGLEDWHPLTRVWHPARLLADLQGYPRPLPCLAKNSKAANAGGPCHEWAVPGPFPSLETLGFEGSVFAWGGGV